MHVQDTFIDRLYEHLNRRQLRCRAVPGRQGPAVIVQWAADSGLSRCEIFSANRLERLGLEASVRMIEARMKGLPA